MKTISYRNALEAQSKIVDLIGRTKSVDSMTPVTLLADNHRTGNQIVNQISRRYFELNENSSLIAVTHVTASQLLDRLSVEMDLDWSFTQFESSVTQLVYELLHTNDQIIPRDLLTPATIQSIIDYVSRFNWIDLEDADLTKRINHSQATSTAIKLFDFAVQVHEALDKSKVATPTKLLKSIKKSLSASSKEILKEEFGVFVVTSSASSSILKGVIEDISGTESFYSLELETENFAEIEGYAGKTLNLVSFPDVFTEIRATLKTLSNYLSERDNPDRIGILYTDAVEYSKPLASALDNAGIPWHGPSSEMPANSRLAILFSDIMDYAADSGDLKFDRKFLLRAIRSGLLKRPDDFPEGLYWPIVEKFVREQGLFGSVASWIPRLSQLSGTESEVLDEIEELEKHPEDNEDLIKSKKRELVATQSAKAILYLANLVMGFKTALNDVSRTDSEVAGSKLALELLDVLVNRNSKKLTSVDSTAMQILSQLESASSSSIVSNDRAVANALQAKAKQALRVSGAYRKDGGVFVGELAASPLLCFDALIVLGSSEGSLPKRQIENPLISNELCNILDQMHPGMFPSTVEISGLERVLAHSIFASADQITFSFARSGLVGSGSGHISPLLDKIPSLSTRSVSDFSEYTDQEGNAVLPFDLARKRLLQGATGLNSDREAQPGLDSAVALYAHEFGHFSGNFKVDVSEYLTDKALSPSAIETYLKCPHKFFVTKILGFVFEDEDDEIEVFRASDFGTIVHSSFELFHKLCLADNHLPNFGEAFSETAIEKFSLIFNQECDRAIAKGQAGWLPLFEQKRTTVLKNLNLYFGLEHKHRNMSPGGQFLLRDAFALRPHLAEYSFDLDGLMPIQIPVEGSKSTHKIQFKGRMDRADKSRSDYLAGIVDFKTGRAASITSSAEEHIQDLVYSYALRHNSADFSNTKIVLFSYLTLNKEKESKLVNLRDKYPDGQEVDGAIFKSESEGGYSDSELPAKVEEHNSKLDGLLLTHLKSLVVAAETGNFPLNPESKSVTYCEVCSDSFGRTNAKMILANSKNGK